MRQMRRAPSASVVRDERALNAAEDAILMERVAAGDRQDSLVALYDRYGARVYGLGLRLLGDRGMAEELVQDTFVRLWRASSRFDPERASVRTFLFMLARRAAVDLQRRASARPLPSVADDGQLEGAEQDAGFDEVVLGLDVRDALEALSDDHRHVLELHYVEDLTQQEIANCLGLALGTVKTRTFYGLRALRQALEEREVLA